MVTAYFITATCLCLWLYWQTRSAARSIRDGRTHDADLLGHVIPDAASRK